MILFGTIEGAPVASLLGQEGVTAGLDVASLLALVAALGLVLANGFFAAAEFAFVTVRRSRVEQLVAEGNRAARIVQTAIDNLDTYVAASQLGITMASLGLGWIGEPALAHLIEPLLEFLPADWRAGGSHAIAVAIAFVIITAFHVVLGEVVPKNLGLARAERVAMFAAAPMTVFMRIFGPAIAVLNGLGNWMVRLFGIRGVSEEHKVHSVEELIYLMTASRKAGVLEAAEEEIATRALAVGDLTARRLMVPRTEMVAVPADITLDGFYDVVTREHHTRVPVYEENLDHILGVLHLTDVIAWELAHAGERFNARAVMRPPMLVPESIDGDRLLGRMRQERTHTAIVVDEFGGVAGLVAFQDLLERIVGDVPEVGEDNPSDFATLPDGSIQIDGLAPLVDLEARLDTDLGEHDAETVGGYVLERLGRIPVVGEEADLGSYLLRVEEMDGPRVAQVVLVKK